jgi:hypothetical protein
MHHDEANRNAGMTTTGAMNAEKVVRASATPRVCVVVVLALVAGSGLAQETQPPAATPPAAPGQMPRPFEPGFFDAVGRWFERGADDLNSKAKAARDNAKGAFEDMGEKAKAAGTAAKDAAKDAAEKFSKLPGARVVEGRERCEVAPNGSADCRTSVESICRTKGLAAGKSLDIQQAEKCSVRSWLAGPPAKSDCKTETHVTRAVCQ